MKYKEIVDKVSKEQSIVFMTYLNQKYKENNANYWYDQYPRLVVNGLNMIGFDLVGISSNTADAVVNRLEKKSKITLGF